MFEHWAILLQRIFCKYVPLAVGIVSMVLHFIGLRVIKNKTPPCLEPYRETLQVLTVISLIFDFCFNILFAPAPVFGYHGIHFMGILGSTLNGFQITGIFIFIFSLLIVTHTSFFTAFFFTQIDKKAKICRTIIKWLILAPLFLLLVFAPTHVFLNLKNSTDAKRSNSSQNFPLVAPDAAVFIVTAHNQTLFLFFAVVSAAALLVNLAIMVVFVKKSKHLLAIEQDKYTENGSAGSNTVAPLLEGVIAQAIDPLFYFFVPLLAQIVWMGVQLALPSNLVTETISIILSYACILACSVYGCVHVITLLYCIPPYREWRANKVANRNLGICVDGMAFEAERRDRPSPPPFMMQVGRAGPKPLPKVLLRQI